MNEPNAAIWRKIDEHSAGLSDMKADIRSLEGEQEHFRRDQKELHSLLTGLDAKIDLLVIDIHTAKSGIKFGKWAAGILVTITGLGLTIWATLRG